MEKRAKELIVRLSAKLSLFVVSSILICFNTDFLAHNALFAQTIIFDENFDDFTNWAPAPDNGQGCEWTAEDGWAKIKSMGTNPTGWIFAVYETDLPQPVSPNDDFSFKAFIRCQDGDPPNSTSSTYIELVADNGDRVAIVWWEDSQAGSGYGGIIFGHGGGYIYTNDPDGSGQINPTIDNELEIRRSGSIWTAYLDGEQLGNPVDYYDGRTATKVRIWANKYQFYGYRDGHIDYIQIQTDIDSGNRCLYVEDTPDTAITSILSQLGFNVTTSTVIPPTLSPSDYSLVICQEYSACNPTTAPYVGNYVQNGGGAILLSGTPSSFCGGGYNTSCISEWFGTSNYSNVGISDALVSIDNPLGTSLLANDIIGHSTGWGAAAVTNVVQDATVLAEWDYESGNIYSFIRNYQGGRVAFWADKVSYNDNSRVLFKALCAWTTSQQGEFGSISGTVTDATTNLPIQGASVSASGGYADPDGTDENGFYEIPNVPAGEGYTVTASADGYQANSMENVTVIANQTTTVDFALSQAISCLDVGLLTICADNITNVSGDIYTASGNVRINELLKFDGDLTVDKGNLSITGATLIYIDNIPVGGTPVTVELYNGQFEFGVDAIEAKLTGTTLQAANNLFSMAGLPVVIDAIIFLDSGIRIGGDLILPDILGYISGKITTLQITQSQGIQLVGEIVINEVRIHNIAYLKLFRLTFNTIDDIFNIEAILDTRILSINANAQIVMGLLDSVGVFVVPDPPILLGSTGLSLSGGGGEIIHMASHPDPPLELSIKISLVPAIQGSFNAVEFNELTLGYSFAGRFTGSGNLNIFGYTVASASMEAVLGYLSMEADVNLIEILLGHAEATVSANPQNEINFAGNVNGSLVIPDGEGFPFDNIESIIEWYFGITLPYTIASGQATIDNTKITGGVVIASIFPLAYELAWNGSQLNASFGVNFSLLNTNLFDQRFLMRDDLKIAQNRFEGQSLVLSKNRVNPKLRITNNQLQQSFVLSNLMPTMIIRVEGENSLPDNTVTLPNGVEVTQQNVTQYPTIAYYENSVENKTFFLFQNPAVGEWVVNISGQDSYSMDVFGANVAPAIDLGQLNQLNDQITISWSDSDPDDDALINLYYDTDNHGANGVLIAAGISEDDAANQFTWNLDNVASGNYYVYATIADQANPAIASYALESIKHIAMDAPALPANLTYELSDTSVAFNWNKGASDSTTHIVYYSISDVIDYNSTAFNVGDTTEFVFKTLLPGKSYKFAVTTLSKENAESDFSNIVEFDYYSGTQNNAPVILQQQFPVQAISNVAYVYQVQTYDHDGNNLDFSFLENPDGMSIGNSGLVEWTPDDSQLGIHLVSIKVTDPGGLADSASYFITVFDSLSSTGNLIFNKPAYTSYDDIGLMTLTDANLNTSASDIDSQVVVLFSDSRPEGLDLTLYETQANSGVFSATFQFDEIESGPTTLVVAYGDTIWAEYQDAFPEAMHVGLSSFIEPIVPVSITYEFTVEGGAWYLVSLPVVPEDRSLEALFPETIVAFSWNYETQNYETVSELLSKRAYWLLMSETATNVISGLPLNTYTNSYTAPGWDMIGSVRETNPVLDDPPGSVVAMFGWDALSQNYVVVGPMIAEPQQGYWVLVFGVPSMVTVGNGQEAWASGRIGTETELAVFYENFGALPPPPPSFVSSDRYSEVSLPSSFGLSQNYPNPFNPETRIEYALPQKTFVRIGIYNLLGQRNPSGCSVQNGEQSYRTGST